MRATKPGSGRVDRTPPGTQAASLAAGRRVVGRRVGGVRFRRHGFAIQYWDRGYPDIYRSARKHGVRDEDILHAVIHALAAAEEDSGRVLYLGADRAGNLLVVVSVVREDGTEIVIHAMRMCRIYEPLHRDFGGLDD